MATALLDNIMTIMNPEGVQSFGPNGQVYNSEIKGGFNISTELENTLFNFREGDSSVANSKYLTNLHEAGKIGSTMEFIVTHVGLRVVKYDGSAALEPAEIAAMKACLASANVKIELGSDNTKIGEFTGLHLMAPVDSLASDTTGTCAADVGGVCASNFIRLRYPIPMQKNVELRGRVSFAQAPDTILTTTPNTYGFIVLLYGVKVVST